MSFQGTCPGGSIMQCLSSLQISVIFPEKNTRTICDTHVVLELPVRRTQQPERRGWRQSLRSDTIHETEKSHDTIYPSKLRSCSQNSLRRDAKPSLPPTNSDAISAQLRATESTQKWRASDARFVKLTSHLSLRQAHQHDQRSSSCSSESSVSRFVTTARYSMRSCDFHSASYFVLAIVLWRPFFSLLSCVEVRFPCHCPLWECIVPPPLS